MSAAPTPRELEALKVLWRMGEATVREIYDVLRPNDDPLAALHDDRLDAAVDSATRDARLEGTPLLQKFESRLRRSPQREEPQAGKDLHLKSKTPTQSVLKAFTC